MYFIWFTCLIVVFSQFGDCQVQWAQPMYQQRPRHYDCCSSALEEINGLLQIIKTFDEDRDCQTVQKCEKGCGLSEEIIMKLVNALIYTATQNCRGNGGNGVGGGGNGGGNGLGGGLGGGLNLGLGGGLGGGLLGGSGSGGGSPNGGGSASGGGSANGGGNTTGSGGGGMRPVGGSGNNNNSGLLSDVLEIVGDIL